MPQRDEMEGTLNHSSTQILLLNVSSHLTYHRKLTLWQFRDGAVGFCWFCLGYPQPQQHPNLSLNVSSHRRVAVDPKFVTLLQLRDGAAGFCWPCLGPF